jgi:hypothetical protein
MPFAQKHAIDLLKILTGYLFIPRRILGKYLHGNMAVLCCLMTHSTLPEAMQLLPSLIRLHPHHVSPSCATPAFQVISLLSYLFITNNHLLFNKCNNIINTFETEVTECGCNCIQTSFQTK